MTQPNPFGQAPAAAPPQQEWPAASPFQAGPPAAAPVQPQYPTNPVPQQPAYPPNTAPPAAVPAQAPANFNPADIASLFSDPAKQETDRPRFVELAFRNDGVQGGRLVIIQPLKLETVPNAQQQGKLTDRLTANLVVLDGGHVDVGGKPEKGVPHTGRKETPFVSKSLYISQVALVNQCRDALARRMAGHPGLHLVIGRIAFGQAKAGQNPPYVLNPATDEDKALAGQWFAQFGTELS